MAIIFSTFAIQTRKAIYISVKDLCCIYTTTILSTFFIKSIRATEHWMVQALQSLYFE